MRRLSIVLLCLLSACITPEVVPLSPYKPQKPSIALNVESINVVEHYKSSQTAPYVEHTLPIIPADAVKTWVNKRLKAVGKERRIEVIIKDASAKEEKLQTEGGLKGLVVDEIDTRVNARIEVEMRLYSDKNLSDASINVVAMRSQTFAEHTPLAERDRLLYSMVYAMLDDLDTSLERNIRGQFGDIVMTR